MPKCVYDSLICSSPFLPVPILTCTVTIIITEEDIVFLWIDLYKKITLVFISLYFYPSTEPYWTVMKVATITLSSLRYELWSQNHRMAWSGRDPKHYPVPNPCHRHPLHQAAQVPVQPWAHPGMWHLNLWATCASALTQLATLLIFRNIK